MTSYKIKWKSSVTDATGEGTATFTKERAQQIADDLNKQSEGLIHHWIEEVPQEATR